MTNEEILGVAEIVERATNRFNEQAARFRERSAAYDRLIAEMNADHERKMAEHRAAFGARTEADAKIIEGLRAAADEQVLSASKVAYVLRCAGETPVQAAQRVVKERDGLLTQVQDMRAEIERLQWENKTMHKDAEDGYAEAIKVLGDPIGLSKERDALLAEVAELKTKYSKLLGVCDFIRSYCEPCDPPPEASHITPEGKQTAEGALPQPGDVVRLVREPSADTVGDTLKNSLDWPWESRWGCVGDRGEVVVSVGTMPGARSVRIMNTGVKAWWPLSCIEVVKGGDK